MITRILAVVAVICVIGAADLGFNYVRNWHTNKQCTEGTTLLQFSTWEWMTEKLDCTWPDYDVWCEKGYAGKDFCSMMNAVRREK